MNTDKHCKKIQRSTKIDPEFKNGFATNWYFAISEAFKDALDIKLTEELFCWYWKINEISKHLKDIKKILSNQMELQQNNHLQDQIAKQDTTPAWYSNTKT